MSINSSWNNKFVSAVNDWRSFMWNIFWDAGDFAVLDEQIGGDAEIRVDDSCVFEEIGAEVGEEWFLDKDLH